jgi:hypothetical protein
MAVACDGGWELGEEKEDSYNWLAAQGGVAEMWMEKGAPCFMRTGGVISCAVMSRVRDGVGTAV